MIIPLYILILYVKAQQMQQVFDLNECIKKPDLDLGMIASIGDSVLAGYGSRQYAAWPFFSPLNFREDRGATLVNGGDEDMWSLYKIASYFNPELEGKSTGTHFFNLCRKFLCFWPFNSYRKTDGLNVAATGSFASDIMRQAKELVKRSNALIVKKPELINKWKLVVFLVGLNDQFNFCKGHESSLEYFEYYVRNFLNYLRQNLDHVIVDLLSLWNMDKMVDLSSRHPSCMHNNRQNLFKSVAPCPFDKKNGTEFRKTMKAYQMGQNEILRNLASEYQNGTAWSRKEKMSKPWVAKPSTFKVIYDPSAEEMDLNLLNWNSLTDTDCSHPTKEMHERLASVYWHNLFLSSKDKLRNQFQAFQSGFIKYTCPTSIKFD
eukprot:NODE_84_length_22349_cov_0.357888.p7 type:complete len:376 gc:universal NODE_84_length_22349_cov_0.357888:14914-16041(+)